MNRYVLTGMVAMALVIVSETAKAHIDSFFDVFTELTAGPPYPTPPVELRVSHQAGLTMIETELVSLSLRSATPPDLPLRIEAYDSGGGGGAGLESFFDVFTELSVDLYPADSFFDVFVEVGPPAIDKASPGLVKAILAGHVESFFDVFVEIDIPDLRGYEKLHLHGEVGPGQPLTFADVQIPSPAESFFDVFVTLDSSGPVIRESPLFTMTMTGTFVPEPATVVLLMLGLAGVGALTRRRASV